MYEGQNYIFSHYNTIVGKNSLIIVAEDNKIYSL